MASRVHQTRKRTAGPPDENIVGSNATTSAISSRSVHRAVSAKRLNRRPPSTVTGNRRVLSKPLSHTSNGPMHLSVTPRPREQSSGNMLTPSRIGGTGGSSGPIAARTTPSARLKKHYLSDTESSLSKKSNYRIRSRGISNQRPLADSERPTISNASAAASTSRPQMAGEVTAVTDPSGDCSGGDSVSGAVDVSSKHSHRITSFFRPRRQDIMIWDSDSDSESSSQPSVVTVTAEVHHRNTSMYGAVDPNLLDCHTGIDASDAGEDRCPSSEDGIQHDANSNRSNTDALNRPSSGVVTPSGPSLQAVDATTPDVMRIAPVNSIACSSTESSNVDVTPEVTSRSASVSNTEIVESPIVKRNVRSVRSSVHPTKILELRGSSNQRSLNDCWVTRRHRTSQNTDKSIPDTASPLEISPSTNASPNEPATATSVSTSASVNSCLTEGAIPCLSTPQGQICPVDTIPKAKPGALDAFCMDSEGSHVISPFYYGTPTENQLDLGMIAWTPASEHFKAIDMAVSTESESDGEVAATILLEMVGDAESPDEIPCESRSLHSTTAHITTRRRSARHRELPMEPFEINGRGGCVECEVPSGIATAEALNTCSDAVKEVASGPAKLEVIDGDVGSMLPSVSEDQVEIVLASPVLLEFGDENAVNVDWAEPESTLTTSTTPPGSQRLRKSRRRRSVLSLPKKRRAPPKPQPQFDIVFDEPPPQLKSVLKPPPPVSSEPGSGSADEPEEEMETTSLSDETRKIRFDDTFNVYIPISPLSDKPDGKVRMPEDSPQNDMEAVEEAPKPQAKNKKQGKQKTGKRGRPKKAVKHPPKESFLKDDKIVPTAAAASRPIDAAKRVLFADDDNIDTPPGEESSGADLQSGNGDRVGQMPQDHRPGPSSSPTDARQAPVCTLDDEADDNDDDDDDDIPASEDDGGAEAANDAEPEPSTPIKGHDCKRLKLSEERLKLQEKQLASPVQIIVDKIDDNIASLDDVGEANLLTTGVDFSRRRSRRLSASHIDFSQFFQNEKTSGKTRIRSGDVSTSGCSAAALSTDPDDGATAVRSGDPSPDIVTIGSRSVGTLSKRRGACRGRPPLGARGSATSVRNRASPAEAAKSSQLFPVRGTLDSYNITARKRRLTASLIAELETVQEEDDLSDDTIVSLEGSDDVIPGSGDVIPASSATISTGQDERRSARRRSIRSQQQLLPWSSDKRSIPDVEADIVELPPPGASSSEDGSRLSRLRKRKPPSLGAAGDQGSMFPLFAKAGGGTDAIISKKATKTKQGTVADGKDGPARKRGRRAVAVGGGAKETSAQILQEVVDLVVCTSDDGSASETTPEEQEGAPVEYPRRPERWDKAPFVDHGHVRQDSSDRSDEGNVDSMDSSELPQHSAISLRPVAPDTGNKDEDVGITRAEELRMPVGLIKLSSEASSCAQPAERITRLSSDQLQTTLDGIEKKQGLNLAAPVRFLYDVYRRKFGRSPLDALGQAEPAPGSKPGGSSQADAVPSVAGSDSLWTDLLAPASSKEYIGNRSVVKSLRRWLKEWKASLAKTRGYAADAASIPAVKKGKGSKRGTNSSDEDDDDDGLMRFVFVRGPSGCGKTCLVYALAQELGLRVIEVNASSRRGSKQLSQAIKGATQSHRVMRLTFPLSSSSSASSSGTEGSSSSKQGGVAPARDQKVTDSSSDQQFSLILVDDIDLIFDDDDAFWYGLNAIGESCRVPIILTGSERSRIDDEIFTCPYDQFDLEPVDKAILSTHFKLICLAGYDVSLGDASLANLVATTGGNVRRCLNCLDFWMRTSRPTIADSGDDDCTATPCRDVPDNDDDDVIANQPEVATIAPNPVTLPASLPASSSRLGSLAENAVSLIFSEYLKHISQLTRLVAVSSDDPAGSNSDLTSGSPSASSADDLHILDAYANHADWCCELDVLTSHHKLVPDANPFFAAGWQAWYVPNTTNTASGSLVEAFVNRLEDCQLCHSICRYIAEQNPGDLSRTSHSDTTTATATTAGARSSKSSIDELIPMPNVDELRKIWSFLPESTRTIDIASLSLDYEPSLFTIGHLEMIRRATNERRRFHHYFDRINMDAFDTLKKITTKKLFCTE